MNPLDQYRTLLTRVDELFGEISSRHRAQMKCRLGCHACCKPGLTVSLLEAEAIRQGLKNDPARVENLRALEREAPHAKKRCSFLRAEGACGIYELRPLVCRSHGVPLQFKDPNGGSREDVMRFRDVCSLNFSGEDLGRLPAADVMNLDTLNTLLAMLSKQAYGKSEERVDLTVSALVKPPPP